MAMIPRNLFGQVPALVRLTRPVIPFRATLNDCLATNDRVYVVALEPDGLGIGVNTHAGNYVSLHPSEFEVLAWADAPADDQ